MNAIETRGLSKEYVTGWKAKVKLLALDSLSFQVQPGQIFGFLGPNGAGKSTTIKLLLGLITPTSGEGWMLGVPVHDRRSRERVGFLPEDPSFCVYLRANEFLDLCGKVLKMDRATRKKRIAETLELVGLSHKADVKISDFSRGMLQRIGLAQALINEPDLVVLDEPLNGLDPYGRRELKEILLNIKRMGKTVFFSSHILSDVQEMCDDVGIMNRGQLIACGSIKTLLPASSVKLQVQKLEMDVMSKLEDFTISISRTHHQWEILLSNPDHQSKVVDILHQATIARGETPQPVQISSTMEKLEDFFFRKIEENNQKRGLDLSVKKVSNPDETEK